MKAYTEAQINSAIDAEVAAWVEFFGVVDSDEMSLADAKEGRRRFHRANLLLGHLGELSEYLPSE
ncbi:hypothetical protein [Phyllobacterium phragmitis]|nr:hypothetical protein [Phyllobacterium phragmitis]